MGDRARDTHKDGRGGAVELPWELSGHLSQSRRGQGRFAGLYWLVHRVFVGSAGEWSA